jgi:large subunit ribosomal protein L28
MAMVCDNCGKGIMYGNLVSHAKNRTKRTFKPNLHKKTVVFMGRKMNAKLCTKCIKLFKKAEMALAEQKEATSATPAV